MAHELNLVELVSTVKTLSTQPESYFQPSKNLPNDTLDSLKVLFDFSRQKDPSKENNACPLTELMVEGFDDEQIWQQIELQNNPVVSDIRRQLKQLKGSSDRVQLLPESIKKNNVDVVDDDNDVEFDDSDDDLDNGDNENINGRELMPASSSDDDDDLDVNNIENEDADGDDPEEDCDFENNNLTKEETQKVEDLTNAQESNKQKRIQKQKGRGSIVDDKFFKLSEMTEFLDKMDQQFERSRDGKKTKDGDDDDDEEDDVDLFRDLSSEEEDDDEDADGEDWGNILGNTAKMIGRDIKDSKHKTATDLKYSDYFDPPVDEKGNKANKNMDEDYDSGDDDDDDDEVGDFGSDVDEGMEDDDDDDDGESDDDNDIDDEIGEDNADSDVSEDENKSKPLSKHEKEQEKLKKKISQLEKENLSKKPWQMGGEAGSATRPINSLLEEDLNFDHTTAAAPPITEETTKNLEDIIKQRIKDEAWDDVERKQKPVTEPFEYKKKLPLDQEKSKLSLSQIYEQEYIKQTDVKEGPQEEQESEEHKEIKQLMSKLFAKLDALSNFHFTPKPLKPEVKIVTNTPVINMEEVAPVAVSDAMMLAPEETHEKEVELKGDTEKTDTDKKRDRRAKKLKQRMKAKDKEKKAKLVNKLNPGLGNKYAKKNALERIEKESKTAKNVSVIKEDSGEKALKSSSAFFSRLHDEVKQQVNSKKADSKEKRKKKTNTSQLKL